MKVFVVFRVHGGPEATDFDTICGVFRNRGDAQACLGNEDRASRPEDEGGFSGDKPEDNDFMYAEVVQTDDEFNRFEVTEREVK